jgi:hypothetical protein
VLGIANFVLPGHFSFCRPSPVLSSSVVALNKIKRYPDEYGGKGLAIGGLETNIDSVVRSGPGNGDCAIAISQLMAARAGS